MGVAVVGDRVRSHRAGRGGLADRVGDRSAGVVVVGVGGGERPGVGGVGAGGRVSGVGEGKAAGEGLALHANAGTGRGVGVAVVGDRVRSHRAGRISLADRERSREVGRRTEDAVAALRCGDRTGADVAQMQGHAVTIE